MPTGLEPDIVGDDLLVPGRKQQGEVSPEALRVPSHSLVAGVVSEYGKQLPMLTLDWVEPEFDILLSPLSCTRMATP